MNYIFAFGCLGGAVGYTIAYLLPLARGLLDGTKVFDEITASKIAGFILLATIYIMLGGSVAVGFGAESAKVAMITGAGFEGLLRSVSTQIQQA